jgi:hypothetical protein
MKFKPGRFKSRGDKWRRFLILKWSFMGEIPLFLLPILRHGHADGFHAPLRLDVKSWQRYISTYKSTMEGNGL